MTDGGLGGEARSSLANALRMTSCALRAPIPRPPMALFERAVKNERMRRQGL